ncbi:hypothetical protein ISP15_17275 [Dyella jejuensis]|uniref:Polymer-forming cytoskeletal protein n=1 Tax=Dyella jejuensis TaxID=1432009 RepID=A0ABW8JPI8_9GAMM
MRLTILALTLLLPLAVAAQDIDKINGTASVEAGEHVGNVRSVNGSVNIGDGAVVEDASTVNGTVELGEKAHANALHTVNGAITLAANSQVRGEVKSTNGAISLDPGAEVTEGVANVNGRITLNHAHVAGGIETTSGDIIVGENSRVEGGILVNEASRYGWNRQERKPHIVIGPHAIVRGTLEFRREVVLEVSSSAQIGPVKGATPQTFGGSMP